MLTRTSLITLLALTACTGARTADQAYYSARSAYAVALDAATGYAQWCAEQPDKTTCGANVVEMVNLEAKAKTAIENANARVDAGSKTGVALAELAAEASIAALTDYLTAHPKGA